MTIYYPDYSPRESAFRTSFPFDEAFESPLISIPGSKHISDLPNEILISVFYEGCELDDSIWSIEKVVYRRMHYPLISVARKVCVRWKCIIDGDDSFNRGHFWFTLLRLSLDLFGKPFIHQVIQFNWALVRSQDCDLYIEFSFPWSKEAEELSTTDAASLNLITRTIMLLVPHQKQVTTLRIDVFQPQFLKHLLQLFATKLNNMSRCSSIVFINPPPPLSYIISKQSIVPPDICMSIYRAATSSRLLPRILHASFVGHGRHSWDISWMDGGIMKFPFFITHLEIPELSLHKNYGFFDTIRNKLASLTISSSDEHRDLDVTWDIILQPPLNAIDFPKLRLLCMSDPSSGSGWADHFFNNVSCPQLRFAKITGIQSHPFSSLADTFDPTMQIPVFPHLQELTIKEIDVSQHSLSCLARLASPSVRKLEIRSLSFHGCRGSDRQRRTDVLRGVFRHMCPLEISLDRLYQHEVSLPGVFDFSAVRELAIGAINDIRRDIRVVLFPGSAKIQAPLLSKLEISARYFSPRILPETFQCATLTTLNLNITDITDDRTFLKIRSNDITRLLTELDSPRESQFPNLQNLHLIIWTRSIGINDVMQIADQLSARRHLNGSTLLALQQVDSKEFWTQPDLKSIPSTWEMLPLSYLRYMGWEHIVTLKASPIGCVSCQPKQSRRIVLTNERFGIIDQIDFNDAHQIAQRDLNHWVNRTMNFDDPRKTKGNRAANQIDRSTDPRFWNFNILRLC